MKLRSKLNSIIEVRNEDNLNTHLRQTMLLKDDGKVSGTIGAHYFKVWVHEQGRGGVTGIFYPVIEGQLNPLNQGLEIELRSKMNIVGKSILIVIAAILAYVVITGIVIQTNNEIHFLIPRLFAGIALFTLMLSVPAFIYFRTCRTITAYLVKELALKKPHNKAEHG